LIEPLASLTYRGKTKSPEALLTASYMADKDEPTSGIKRRLFLVISSRFCISNKFIYTCRLEICYDV